jgi:hypothetical protein
MDINQMQDRESGEDKETEEQLVAAGEEEPEQEFEPQPETLDSLCYSCANYEKCHEKKSTVKSCITYVNRRESQKTDEDRYNEEQDAIDRDTQKKLREQAQEEKMQQLPSDKKSKEHDIRLAASRYDDITSETLTFLLLKKDGFKVGEEISLPEYEDGKQTGRAIEIKIMYIMEDWTGLEEDYCIIGFVVQAWS